MAEQNKTGKRKRPKSFYINKRINIKKKRFMSELEPGLSGFLFTCNTKNERFAVSEAYSLLNEYADDIYGKEEALRRLNNEDSEPDEDESIEDALAKEITTIKDLKKQERRFQSVKTGVKNVLFIKTTLSDPNELVYKIFSDLEQKGIKKTRHCLRLLPVQLTCYASMDKIKKHLQPVIDQEFDISPIKFYVQFKSRCNASGSIKKEDVLHTLSKMVLDGKKGHTIDYNHPDSIINIDVVRNVCLLGILKNFSRFRKYNLHSIVEGKDEKIDKETEGNIPVIDEMIQEHKEMGKETKSREEMNGVSAMEDEREQLDDKSQVNEMIEEANIDSIKGNTTQENDSKLKKEEVNNAKSVEKAISEGEQGDDKPVQDKMIEEANVDSIKGNTMQENDSKSAEEGNNVKSAEEASGQEKGDDKPVQDKMMEEANVDSIKRNTTQENDSKLEEEVNNAKSMEESNK